MTYSGNSSDTENVEVLLEIVTNEAVWKRIPCIIYIGCISLLGIIGNLHVIIVFSKPGIKSSTYTIFVKTLALIDLSACCLQMPMEIYDLVNAYTFYNKIGCKLFRCMNQIFLFSSDFTLLFIAYDRYRRISKPLDIQMSINRSKRLCSLAIVSAVIIATPLYPISGHKIVHFELNHAQVTDESTRNLTVNGNTSHASVTGYMCYFDDDVKDSLLVYIYTGFLTIWYIVSLVVLTFTYICIIRIVFKRNSRTDRNNKSVITGQSLSGGHAQKYSLSSSNSSTSDIIVPVAERLKISTVKTTRSLFLITGVFVITFTPVVSLVSVIAFVNSDFKDNFNYAEFSLYQIGIRLMFINNVANPFVYGFTDQRFKSTIKEFYGKCRKTK